MKSVLFFVLTLFAVSAGNAAYKKLESPFLGSTKEFKEAKEHKDLYVYRHAEKKVVDYKKIIFDHVLIYQSPNSWERQLTQDELIALGTDFQDIVKDRFKDIVQIVSEPGAGVLRVRFAMRGLRRGSYYMDEGGDHKIQPDTKLAAGTIEMEAIDSLTGERVVALVQNVGSEEVRKSKKEKTVGTIHSLFTNWVEMLRGVLLEKINAANMEMSK